MAEVRVLLPRGRHTHTFSMSAMGFMSLMGHTLHSHRCLRTQGIFGQETATCCKDQRTQFNSLATFRLVILSCSSLPFPVSGGLCGSWLPQGTRRASLPCPLAGIACSIPHLALQAQPCCHATQTSTVLLPQVSSKDLAEEGRKQARLPGGLASASVNPRASKAR
jgi:hypothetical protein